MLEITTDFGIHCTHTYCCVVLFSSSRRTTDDDACSGCLARSSICGYLARNCVFDHSARHTYYCCVYLVIVVCTKIDSSLCKLEYARAAHAFMAIDAFQTRLVCAPWVI